MAKFCVPVVGDNPEGWGPMEEPAHLKHVPYAPFSKSEKLGKIADFIQPGGFQKQHGRTHHTQAPLVFNFLNNDQVKPKTIHRKTSLSRMPISILPFRVLQNQRAIVRQEPHDVSINNNAHGILFSKVLVAEIRFQT